MPRETVTEKLLPALYKRSLLNISMFAFVRGTREALHTITIEQAIGMFMSNYGIDEDEYNVTSAMSTFNRMQNELKLLTTRNSNDGR